MSKESIFLSDTNETIWEPIIISASFDQNPATVGVPVLLRVTVLDVFGSEQEEVHYSGEWYAGEA